MSRPGRRRAAGPPAAGVAPRRGFSLVEVIVSLVVVSLMFTVAMNTVGASRAGLSRIGEMGRARLLAHQLVSEIMQCRYREAQAGGTFGPESGESSGTGDRTAFDDVDDYDGYSSSPPQRRDGTVIEGLDAWEQSVEVAWVDPADLGVERSSETGVKRIIVRVGRPGIAPAEIHAVRADLDP